MASLVRFVNDAVFGTSSKGEGRSWDNPAAYARAAALVVLLCILAGVVLRLCGFVGGAYSWFFLNNALDDSWLPMGLAYDRVTGKTPGTLHDLFFVDHVKFQYPASSLLLYSALDLVGITPTVRSLNVLVWLSVLATPFVVFRLCAAYIDKQQSSLRFSNTDKYMIAGAFAVSTLFFYPIMISWRLGQIQAMLNLAFAAACLCWVSDRKYAAGALIGLSCLVKPQFSLFLIWALLRRQKQFAVGQAAIVGGGLALSWLMYGWRDNIYYLDVLQYVSQRGEIFWDNSSINGLLNGIMHPDQTLIFKYHEYAPYDPVTYGVTFVTTVLIIGFALFKNRATSAAGSMLDFMTAAFSFTLGSPMAWGHHYGIALPIFAVAFIEIARQMYGARRRNYLIGWAVCFLLFSNYWNVTELLAGTPAAILQNWRLFAAFGFLFILYSLQAETKEGDQGLLRQSSRAVA